LNKKYQPVIFRKPQGMTIIKIFFKPGIFDDRWNPMAIQLDGKVGIGYQYQTDLMVELASDINTEPI
jgi:hypothetical protein